jgi:hypothetical protein
MTVQEKLDCFASLAMTATGIGSYQRDLVPIKPSGRIVPLSQCAGSS